MTQDYDSKITKRCCYTVSQNYQMGHMTYFRIYVNTDVCPVGDKITLITLYHNHLSRHLTMVSRWLINILKARSIGFYLYIIRFVGARSHRFLSVRIISLPIASFKIINGALLFAFWYCLFLKYRVKSINRHMNMIITFALHLQSCSLQISLSVIYKKFLN